MIEKIITVLITGADHFTGLGTARALNGLNVKRIGLCTNPKARSCRSNVWDTLIKISEDEKKFLKELIEIGESLGGGKAVVFATRDCDVVLLSENRAQLGQYFSFVLPEQSAVDLMMNKTAFHAWAVERGFPVPESYMAGTQEELDDVLSMITYPAVLKPVVRSLKWENRFPSDKVLKFNSKAEFDMIKFDFFSATPKVIVQQWIPGGDENVYFCLMYTGKNGCELGCLTGRKLLQWPIGTGSTAIGITERNDEVQRISREVLNAAGLKGLGSLELKFSEKDKKYYITEPTVGRNDLQSFLAVAAGVNLTRVAFADTTGSEEVLVTAPRKAVWIEEYSAIQAVKKSLSQGNFKFRIFLECISWRWSFSSLSLWDPMPFVTLIMTLLKHKFNQLTRFRIAKIANLFRERSLPEIGLYLPKRIGKGIFCYSVEKYYVFEREIDGDASVATPGIDVDLCEINNKEEIDELVRFWPDYFRFSRTDEELERSIRHYFKSGDECLCAKFRGRIVGMAWAGYQGNHMLKSMAKKIGLRENEAILHRGYVSEEMRGQGLYNFLLTSLSNHVRRKGCKKWFAYVGASNAASIKIHARIASSYRMLTHMQLKFFGITLNIFPRCSKRIIGLKTKTGKMMHREI